MNRIFKLIWSRQLGMLIPVAEISRSIARGGKLRSRRSARSLQRLALSRKLRRDLLRRLAEGAGALLLVLVPVSAFALPHGGQVTAGSADISKNGSTMTVIQNSQKAAIDWQRFGIGAGQSVNFHQPGSSSIALNRVTGSEPSQIYGHLTANGQVFLVNPNGVYFAPGAEVNVGGLVASTKAISNQDFMAGKYHFNGDSDAGVINDGTIKAARGGGSYAVD